jgi:kynureninase
MAVTQAEPTSRDYALALDAADELASFRDRFVIPDPSLIYYDGNSLGRMPAATASRLREVAEREWAAKLIPAWPEIWNAMPTRVGDLIGTGLLGARPGEVIVSDSTTVNFYKLVHAALDARPGRRVIVTDRDNFPTDRHVLEGVAQARGLEIRWLERTSVHGPQPADVAAALDDQVALVTLSHVAYRTAAIADMPAITALAHRAGALALWDVCHAVGAIPIDLTSAGVDLAVGCTYKYLNSGPGAPSFLYVRADAQRELRNPIWGWWSLPDMYDMTMRSYRPAPDVRAYQTGTPSILALAAVEEGVRLQLEAGLPRLRAKGIALTEYAITLFDRWLASCGFRLDSPREASRRGSHIAVAHDAAPTIWRALHERGVICGSRQPDGLRIGLAPMTTSFADVHDGFAILAELGRELTGTQIAGDGR